MDELVIGPVTVWTNRVLALIILGYAALVARFTVNAFRVRLADRWSAGLAVPVLAGLAAALWLRPDLHPAPFSLWSLAAAIGGVIATLTWTLGRYQDLVDRFRESFGERLNALLADTVPEDRLARLQTLRERFQWSHEARRKTPHLLMGIFLVWYAVAGHYLVFGMWRLFQGGAEPVGAGEAAINLYHVAHGPWLAAGHHTGIFALLLVLFVLLPTELLRLRFPELGYPFKAIILTRLREKEHGIFGAHLYIIATLPLAALWLAEDAATWPRTVPAILAVLAVTVFADAASALFGRRFGRRKWFHNDNKTYLGSVAGTLVAFAVALPFTGVVMAVAAAAAFLLVDAIAPVPIHITDNILNPLALAVVFWVGQAALAPMMPWY